MATTSEISTPRTIAAEQAEETLSDIAGWVRDHKAEVIVARGGTPEAVLVPMGVYEELRALREQRERRGREAVDTFRRIRAQIAARNPDLTDEEADDIAAQFRRDVVQGLIDKGKIRFVEP